MSKQPPMPPINTDPQQAIEGAISALREVVRQRPEVRQIFDCEAFIKYELEGALAALVAAVPACAAPVAPASAPPSALVGRLEALLDFHQTGSKAHSHEFHAASVESALRIIAAAPAPVTHTLEARQTEPRPISEVSIPMAEVLRTKCQGCGKSPLDFLA